MSLTPIFAGRVNEQGQLRLEQPEAFERQRHSLRGRQVELVLRAQRIQRSVQQNRYYWKVVVGLFAEYCGYTPEEAHEVLKLECNAITLVNRRTLDITKVPGSTRELSTVDFKLYYQRCQQWIAEHCDGLYIPDPNEAEWAA